MRCQKKACVKNITTWIDRLSDRLGNPIAINIKPVSIQFPLVNCFNRYISVMRFLLELSDSDTTFPPKISQYEKDNEDIEASDELEERVHYQDSAIRNRRNLWINKTVPYELGRRISCKLVPLYFHVQNARI